MGARDGKKRQAEPDPIPPTGLYCCSSCRRPLALELVLRADIERREDGTATGFIGFEHFCPCREGAILSSRALGSYPSFLALWGKQPKLPYEAPFAWRPVPEDDPVVSRWAWELGQVADWGEFMLFLSQNPAA